MMLGTLWSVFNSSALTGSCPCSTSSPTTPHLGVPLRVKTANDDNLVPHQAIEDAVGESLQEESPGVPVDYRRSQRVSGDHLEPHLNRSKELLP